MCLSIMIVIFVKQHLSNIWGSIHEKVKHHRLSWKKALFIKKQACTSKGAMTFLPTGNELREAR